jgi:peptidoglycan/LPS O-acetylase OafA/YrhL
MQTKSEPVGVDCVNRKALESQRNLSVDIIKFIAAFGVVIIHLAPSTEAADLLTQVFLAFAVPFFLVTSLHFFISRILTLPAVKYSDLRWDRILVPYAVWTLIYTLLRVLKFRLAGTSLSIDVVGFCLYGGVAVHLYFLPLLLLFQSQALAMILLLRVPRLWLTVVGIALGAGIFGYIGTVCGYLGFSRAFESGMVYVALAFALGWLQAREVGRRINLAIGSLILILIFTTVFYGVPLYSFPMLRGPIAGYGVAALALNWRVASAAPALRLLVTCSYGIYLAHFGFLEGLEFAAQRFGLLLAPYSVTAKLAAGSLICLACVAFIVIARLHRLSAYLLIGEHTSNRVKMEMECGAVAAPLN